jgi:flagellar M-ring protein FliF
MKQLAAILTVLFILFGILRPTMRNLTGWNEAKKAAALAEEQGKMAATGELVYAQDGTPMAALGSQQQAQAALPNHIEDLLLVDTPHSYGKRLEYLQNIVDKDPQLVAQVLKRWVR